MNLPPGFSAKAIRRVPEDVEADEDGEELQVQEGHDTFDVNGHYGQPKASQSGQFSGPSRRDSSFERNQVNESPHQDKQGKSSFPPRAPGHVHNLYMSQPMHKKNQSQSGTASTWKVPQFMSMPLDHLAGLAKEHEQKFLARNSGIDSTTSDKDLIENRSASFIDCTDPTCTVCPPEMHTYRRKKFMDAVEKEKGPFPSGDEEEGSRWGCFSNPFAFNRLNGAQEAGGRREGWVIQLVRIIFGPFLALTGVLNPHSKFVKNWLQCFLCVCLFSFAIDPLFFFVFTLDRTNFCLYINWSFATTLTVLRTFCDAFYFLHIFIQFRLAYVAPGMVEEGDALRARASPNELVYDPKAVAYHYLSTTFLLDFLAALPLPQIVMFAVVPSWHLGNSQLYWKSLVRLSLLLQYFPRLIRFFRLLTGVDMPVVHIFETAWARFTLNLLLYFMSSHVVGCIWYLFTIQRLHRCMSNKCRDEAQPISCQENFLVCNNRESDIGPQQEAWAKLTNMTSSCLWAKNSTDFFDYGIYAPGIDLSYTPNVIDKIAYAIAWGFSQISTLGGQLVPSIFLGEVLFVLAVTAMGLMLFAMLISNMQNHLQSLGQRSFDYQLRLRDVEGWMRQRNLPLRVRKRVRQLERFQWSANRGVDEEELLGTLSDDLKREVRRHLYLELIKKSILFRSMPDLVLDAICERLRQRLFIEGTVVIREGSPVSRMFFVLRGELLSIATHRGRTGFVSSAVLQKGDFFGEELLIAYLEKYWQGKRCHTAAAAAEAKSSPSDYVILPIAECTVECMGPVEGFSLDANDLDFVCAQFARELHSASVQRALNECSHPRRTRAAVTIQVAWRRFVRKWLGLTFVDILQASRTRTVGRLIRASRATHKMSKVASV
eukprot:jgi/Mesen1/3044/ME000018S02352